MIKLAANLVPKLEFGNKIGVTGANMQLFFWRKRPLHLGKYLMETIKRVEKPTTRITDNIPRIPKRANFFTRSFFGDLGPKPQREIKRFVSKYPLSEAMGDIMNSQIPLHDGETGSEMAPTVDYQSYYYD